MANWKNLWSVQGIVALILGILGLIWLINSLYRMYKINQINNWPKVEAVVVTSLARPANATAGTQYVDPDNLAVTTNTADRYLPVVTYNYNVGGRDYQSGNVIFHPAKSYSALDTKNLLGNIRPNSRISVFYNPRNPAEAYIYNATTSSLWAILISALMTAIGIYLGYKVVHNPANVSFSSKKPSQGQPAYPSSEFNLTDVANKPANAPAYVAAARRGHFH
jgi:hypothetical protein